MADLTNISSDSIDPERLRRIMALSQPGVPPAAAMPEAPKIDRLSPIASSSLPPSDATRLQPIGFKQRQSLPMTSPGVEAGSSADYRNQLQRIEDQKANPLGSANNHPGMVGKLEHIGGRIANIAGDILAPGTTALIPGSDLNKNIEKSNVTRQLDEAQTRESADTARKSSEDIAQKDLALRTRKEDFEEGKPEKPGTPDEQAISAKMKETDPKTGKPYTAFDARIALSQGIEDTKPDKNAAEPKTVTMLDKEGGKPYLYQHDPKGNYSGEQGTGQWKKIGPAQPNATTLGIVGTMTPLLNPDGSFSGHTFNNKTGKVGEVDTSHLDGATTSAGARLKNTEANQFNTQYVKPATDIEQNFQKFMGARKEYDANPQTGAASMAALAQHLGSTFGSIKGAQMGEHMVQEHKEALGLLDRIGRYADQMASGQQLSKSQWDDFQKLITNTRDIQWETTAREAARRGQKIDFLPADTHIQMADSQGHARYVTGDKVQEYLDRGAKIQ